MGAAIPADNRWHNDEVKPPVVDIFPIHGAFGLGCRMAHYLRVHTWTGKHREGVSGAVDEIPSGCRGAFQHTNDEPLLGAGGILR